MARLYLPGDAYAASFTVSSATGAAANADSTPTGSILRNGAADGAVTVTVTNPATGQYKAAATVPSGYAAGDVVELLIAATVGGVATKGIVDRVRLVAFNAGNAVNLGLSNLDATVSSRSTYAGGDTSGVTSLLARLTAPRATNLDNLDAAISSRSIYAGGAVSSVTAGVTVTTNSDKTGYALSVTPPTLLQIVAGVWDALTSSLTTTGSIGKVLAALFAPKATGTVVSADSTHVVVTGMVGSSGQYAGRRLYVELAAGGDLYTDACSAESGNSTSRTFTFAVSQAAIAASSDPVRVLGK